MKRPKVNVMSRKLLDSLSESEWKELALTGVVIKGDIIIRTLSHIKRVHSGAKKEISKISGRLFSSG